MNFKLKKVMAKTLSLLTALVLMISVSSMTVTALDFSGKGKDIISIQQTIEGLINRFESNVGTSNDNKLTYDEFFIGEQDDETQACIALIETIEYYRNCVIDKSDIDLTEYNKSFSFDYLQIDIEQFTANIVLSVTKEFNYSFSKDIKSATRDKYIIKMIKENDTWRIKRISGFVDPISAKTWKENGIDIDNKESINNYKSMIPQLLSVQKKQYNEEKIITSPKATAVSYNRNGACNYALQHALSYNTNYMNFNGYGGDCTNFTSQCLYEGGGIPKHYGSNGYGNCWYYTSSSNRSSTWAGVSQFKQYIYSSVSKINVQHSNWSSVQFGDLIQLAGSDGNFNYGHSLIITGIAMSSYGRSDLMVCAHTIDRCHVSYNTYYPTSSYPTRVYHHIIGSK